MISKHFDKNSLHHAYLIEGDRNEVVPEILKLCEGMNVKTSGNPDFCHIAIDSFKIDEAFSLRAMSSDKAFGAQKKIFIVSTNSITLDAQNVLLKMFEEPTPSTHFFLVVPDTNSLLKTLVSRFYYISSKENLDMQDAEKFISLPIYKRIDFLKEFLAESDEADNGAETLVLNSARSSALKFLNALESALHNKLTKDFPNFKIFEQFFEVRKFLRMPGSSVKMLMESIALVIPEKK